MDKTSKSTAEVLFEYFDKKSKKYVRNETKQEDRRLNQFKKLILQMSFFELKEAKVIFDTEFNYFNEIFDTMKNESEEKSNG